MIYDAPPNLTECYKCNYSVRGGGFCRWAMMCIVLCEIYIAIHKFHALPMVYKGYSSFTPHPLPLQL